MIELRNISFSYALGHEKISILKNVSLFVNPGEVVAIQGPSGSGKSTLLYILGLLQPPHSGQVLINGKDVTLLNDVELSKIRQDNLGFVFQQFHLLPRTTVIDNVLLPAQYSDGNLQKFKQSAKKLIAQVGLENRISHKSNELSGGQQQRVAIARALINSPSLILADEPTGNLDSKSSAQIMEILKDLAKNGKSVVIITHDPNIAAACDRSYFMVDGEISSPHQTAQLKLAPQTPEKSAYFKFSTQAFFESIKVSFKNLDRNRTRSILTMFGITLGIAAMFSMLTLGTFVKEKMIEGYAELGVNTISMSGYPNWERKATEKVGIGYYGFNMEKDLQPLKEIFPQIERFSPILTQWWGSKISYGGRTVDQDVRVLGLSPEAFLITQPDLEMGTPFNEFHVTQRTSVCVIGQEIKQRLFKEINPIGKIAFISSQDNSYGCKITGVMATRSSKDQWKKPNTEIFVPWTTFMVNYSGWSSRIYNVMFQLKPSSDMVAVNETIKNYFELKYGAAGRFQVNSDVALLANMKKFLSLFTILLGAIAATTLLVGGVGITNMMTVSVNERMKEIGLRRAVGANKKNIRLQFLLEAILLCAVAGLAGLILGVAAYEGAIYLAQSFIPTLKFQWLFDMNSFLISFVSILVVGILSGLSPALKAENLSVVDALRSE